MGNKALGPHTEISVVLNSHHALQQRDVSRIWKQGKFVIVSDTGLNRLEGFYLRE